MSGLPPTGPNNKVSVRSKTASFKRPISCDVNEHKKENKGIFAKLKKGSSNSRLDEESQYNDTTIYIKPNNVYNNQENLSVSRIQGRNFDSDDEDYELDMGDTVVTKMEKLFINHQKVISNPALFGSILKYLITHNLDYYSLLFYVIVQHYKNTIQNKEFSKELLRLVNEIYTTFLHDKSILKIRHMDIKPIIFEDLKSLKDFSTVFEDYSKFIFNHFIIESINKVKSSIAHGLFTVEMNIDVMSFEEKLVYFNNIIKFIIKNLEDKVPRELNQNATKESKDQELFQLEVISGVKSSLATIYCYFSKKEKEDNSDNVSLVSSKLNSFLGKSTENLQVMTNCVLDKQSMFCTKIHKKPSSHSFFKKGKVLKGHNFQEKNFEYPAECLYCNKLLWGISPQGFHCSHCQGAAHKNCKDFVRVACQKDLRKYQRNPSNNISPPIDDDVSRNSILEENLPKEVVNNFSDVKDTQDIANSLEQVEKVAQIEGEHISEDGMQISTSSVSSDVSQNIKSNYVISTATIIVTNNDERIIDNNMDTESINSVSEISTSDKQHDLTKSESDKKENHFEERSHVKSLANKYDQKSISRTQSDNSIESSTLPRYNKRTSESVDVQNLIQDTGMWSNDPDMEVGETFEADKELLAFPEHLSKDQDKAAYTRLLVLMEFHHKTKFTVMTLKRFDYLLLKPWPSDEGLLYKTLSLNCIIPLYELIKSLANTIESCRNKSTFTPETAKKVLAWLVDNEETNLQEWLKYSIDLCCTNSLLAVKNTWRDYRKSDPKFSGVLNKRFNKMIMVEQLANMRPLLFNFPLIVNKLFRDLSKFSKFKEETKIWKEIHEKFKLLPTFIDVYCMPLVQKINDGVITNGFDRSSWMSKLSQSDPSYDYIIDFPKTAFHYKLFDIQEIKISNFRESGNKTKTPAVFVKETCDAYAICYENILVLLQKENEKFVLKQFKATDASKCNPILIVDNVHTSKGDKKGGMHELTLVFINVAVLTQVLFSSQSTMEKWHDFIYKIKTKNIKKTESFNNNNNIPKTMDFGLPIKEFNMSGIESLSKDELSVDKIPDVHNGKLPLNSDLEMENTQYQFPPEDVLAKYETVKDSIDNYLSCLNSMKPDSNNENIFYPSPSDCYEFLIGTTYDAGNILKLCNESFNMEAINKSSHNFIKDETLDQIISNLSVMQNRVSHYKNTRDKDTLSISDIECNPEMMEHSYQSMDNTPPESLKFNESEELDEIMLVSMENCIQSSIDIILQDTVFAEEVNEDDIEKIEQKEEIIFHDDLISFVDEYVNKIIADAQLEISQISEENSDINSDTKSIDNNNIDDNNDNINDNQDSLYTDHLSEPSA